MDTCETDIEFDASQKVSLWIRMKDLRCYQLFSTVQRRNSVVHSTLCLSHRIS